MELSKTKQLKILELYKQGAGVNKIAAQLKIKKNIIKDIIRNNGVQSGMQNIGQDILQEVVYDDVKEKISITEIKEIRLPKHEEYLNSNFDVLVQIIEAYKSQHLKQQIINNDKAEIIVELPVDEIKEFKTSIRINKIIWEQFKEFCKNNKNYTQKDLVSMAILEYMDRYR